MIRTAFLSAFLAAAAVAGPVEDAIQTIREVRPNGIGHRSAKEAVDTLAGQGGAALVPILNAIDGTNPLADNWLRGAFEGAAASGDVPIADLRAFFTDTDNNPRARRLAFETIRRAEAAAAAELAAAAVEDPSPEMRAEAVDALIAQAEDAEGDEAVAIYRKALPGAPLKRQVDAIAKALKAAGEEVDLQKHYGVITDWRVVSPFDNKNEKGFDVEYGPERGDLSDPDPAAQYDSEEGKSGWIAFKTDDAEGTLDLAERVGPLKGTVAYATTAIESETEQPVELRLSTANAWKMWLNGELLFEREEYHRGLQFDGYVVPATLREGRNVVVLKVLQNEQDQPWAQRWSLALRITDPYGRAAEFTQAED